MKNTLKISGLVLALTILFAFTAKNVSITKAETSLITFSDDLMKPMNDMMDRMNKMKMTSDFDTDFSFIMIEHHQGAIDMTEVLAKSGKDQMLKDMMKKGMAMQKEEQVKLKTLQNKSAKSMDMKMDMELMKLMDKMMQEMKSMKMSGDIDRDFAMMMIMHHKSAIEMSKSELAKGKSAELKKLAEKMINDQTKEIAELEKWLNKK